MQQNTIYQQLQQHYQKLQARLQKAQTKGRSPSFQQRLLGRIQRCSLQMKQLGAGVAVVAALGMASPAMGQVTIPFPLLERTGMSNPLDSVEMQMLHSPVFTDIDGDGDMDMFIPNTDAGYASALKYYENVGDSLNPIFTEEPIGNIFYPSTSGNIGRHAYLDFVDIDADGDQDAFITNGGYFAGGPGLGFYEDVSASLGIPTLQRQPDFNNKLGILSQDMNSDIPNATGSGNKVLPAPSFVDIDNDGDMDVFVTFGNSTYYSSYAMNDDVWYYENTGTATIANYVRRTGASNPLSVVPDSIVMQGKIEFYDLDGDGDQDATLTIRNNGVGTSTPYYENTGTAAAPVFTLSSNHPLAQIDTTALCTVTYIDIDNDGDTDVFRTYSMQAAPVATGKVHFYENVQYVGTTSLPAATALAIYPNPSTGNIQLEEALTGTLTVYDLAGKLVYSQELEQEQQLDLSSLQAGVYLVHILTTEKQLIQKVTLTK